jgi:hypothetical protein
MGAAQHVGGARPAAGAARRGWPAGARWTGGERVAPPRRALSGLGARPAASAPVQRPCAGRRARRRPAERRRARAPGRAGGAPHLAVAPATLLSRYPVLLRPQKARASMHGAVGGARGGWEARAGFLRVRGGVGLCIYRRNPPGSPHTPSTAPDRFPDTEPTAPRPRAHPLAAGRLLGRRPGDRVQRREPPEPRAPAARRPACCSRRPPLRSRLARPRRDGSAGRGRRERGRAQGAAGGGAAGDLGDSRGHVGRVRVRTHAWARGAAQRRRRCWAPRSPLQACLPGAQLCGVHAPPCRPVPRPPTSPPPPASCGAAFDVAIVSPLFEGKMLIARHRLVRHCGTPAPRRQCIGWRGPCHHPRPDLARAPTSSGTEAHPTRPSHPSHPIPPPPPTGSPDPRSPEGSHGRHPCAVHQGGVDAGPAAAEAQRRRVSGGRAPGCWRPRVTPSRHANLLLALCAKELSLHSSRAGGACAWLRGHAHGGWQQCGR